MPAGAGGVASVAAVSKRQHLLADGEAVWFPVGYRQDAALRLVAGGDRLLDVGCGRGAVAAALRDRFGELVGVDREAECLDVAARRGVTVVRAEITEGLPFDDEAFDAVLCLEVIEHIADVEAFVGELARVLVPGGRLYLSTPNIRSVGYLAELIVRGRFPRTSADPAGWQGGHLHFFTFRDLNELVGSAGLRVTAEYGLPLSRSRGRLGREFLCPGIFAVAERAAAFRDREEPVRQPRAW